MTTRPSIAHSLTLRLLLAAACAAAALNAAACSKPLLDPRDERSPFDRYDAVRNQYAPQYTENAFGAREPNLRGRLTPKQ